MEKRKRETKKIIRNGTEITVFRFVGDDNWQVQND